jgi:succinate dehydrogenase/fumarate reductase cytochrome b subunit
LSTFFPKRYFILKSLTQVAYFFLGFYFPVLTHGLLAVRLGS